MSRIKTYEDLEAEEKRLQALLNSQKESIKDSIAATKEAMNPVKKAVDSTKKFFVRDKSNPILQFGVDMGVDVLIRRFLLARAGWFTKIVIPYFIRNYSSNLVQKFKELKFYKATAALLNEKRSKRYVKREAAFETPVTPVSIPEPVIATETAAVYPTPEGPQSVSNTP
jgi:hypothetical protein